MFHDRVAAEICRLIRALAAVPKPAMFAGRSPASASPTPRLRTTRERCVDRATRVIRAVLRPSLLAAVLPPCLVLANGCTLLLNSPGGRSSWKRHLGATVDTPISRKLELVPNVN